MHKSNWALNVCTTATDYCTNKRSWKSQLMVFTRVYSIHNLPKTCRPTRTLPVKAWRCPLRLSHAINVQHWELSSAYYTGLPMHHTPATAVRQRQTGETATGGLWAILLHSAGDYRPNDRYCMHILKRTTSAEICQWQNQCRSTEISFGDRSFSAAGRRVWNALPPELWHDISFGLFRRKLKSHLFV